MPQNLSWREAIVDVLRSNGGPMHYTDIASQIVERALREDMGATPDASVRAALTNSIQRDGETSIFVRLGNGTYSMRDVLPPAEPPSSQPSLDAEAASGAGLVKAFGMFWERQKVIWNQNPRMFGQQQAGTREVDFCRQKGVYLLHDAQGVVYVGRVTDQTLGRRLFQHTIDRLSGRWTRFSWFGVYPVTEEGSLQTTATFGSLNVDAAIVAMEAILIEGLEPRQNRKRGDEFQAAEFLQVEDPALIQERKASVVRELLEAIPKR
jgi:hypothetical protein